jgi:multidrug efflux pump
MQTCRRNLLRLKTEGQMRISASAPEGATFEYMDKYVDQMISTIQDNVPELYAINTVTSPGFGAAGSVNSAFGFLTLVDPQRERDRSQQEIADDLTGTLRGYPVHRHLYPSLNRSEAEGGTPGSICIQAQNT